MAENETSREDLEKKLLFVRQEDVHVELHVEHALQTALSLAKEERHSKRREGLVALLILKNVRRSLGAAFSAGQLLDDECFRDVIKKSRCTQLELIGGIRQLLCAVVDEILENVDHKADEN